MWKNAVFVLSHANQLTATKKDPNRLENKLKLFKDAIPEVLMKCGVSKKVAESVPIVLAGHLDIDEHGGGPVLPPITNDWLSDFWFTSLKHMREIAQPALVQANIHRLKKKEDITEEDRKKPAHEQPIAFSIEWIPLRTPWLSNWRNARYHSRRIWRTSWNDSRCSHWWIYRRSYRWICSRSGCKCHFRLKSVCHYA